MKLRTALIAPTVFVMPFLLAIPSGAEEYSANFDVRHAECLETITKDAELAYNYALEADKNNHTALGNLALLYKLTDRDEQASEILDSLDRKRQSNPYYHVSLGNTAYKDGAYRDAIKHYHKAKKLDKKLHDSYFGLAKTYYQLGDLKLAKKYLTMANNKADFDHDKQRYESKLQALRSHTAKLIDYR